MEDSKRFQQQRACAKSVRFNLVPSSGQATTRFWRCYQHGENMERTALENGNSLAFRLGEQCLQRLCEKRKAVRGL